MDVNERRALVSAEAAEWWVRLQSQGVEHAGRAQFVDWLRESHIHVAEMLRVAQVHGALDQFKHWARIATDGAREDSAVVPLIAAVEIRPEIIRWPAWKRLLPSAAVLAAALVAVAILWPRLPGKVIVTDRGDRREVVLNDGSILLIDPQTQVRIQYSSESRRVMLDSGRALFRVAQIPGRPFLVQADQTMVRALGTTFGVERQSKGVVVTVAEGKVAVLSPSSGKLPPRIELIADQQLTVPHIGQVAPVRKVDGERELAWAQGRLVFANDQVKEVLKQFNRYNRVQLQVTDAALASRPVSGVFSASDPESFIAFIQSVAPVRVERHGDQDIVLSPP
jgi:transmembrane sensor